MAAIRTTTAMFLREIFAQPLSPLPAIRRIRPPFPCFGATLRPAQRGVSFTRIRCAVSGGAGEKKAPSRLAQVQQLLQEAEERALSAGDQPTPKITLDHVTVSFARSGGPGGQNVNKVNTKVDMRFNVKKAYWLSDRIRERIMQMEKNRINKDDEIVISSTKTRTQKSLPSLFSLHFIGFATLCGSWLTILPLCRGNIDDALGKLQAIIDAASYVPPPPSEEQKKKIAKMAAIGEQKRLKSKKALSDKKAFRRSRDGWD